MHYAAVTEPLSLRRVPFYSRYCPPPPPEPGKRRLPEEIEAELKLQEQELEKLALVNITYVTIPSCVTHATISLMCLAA